MQDPRSDDRVAVQELPLVLGEGPGLFEDCRRDRHLAHVVQCGGEPDAHDLGGGQSELDRHCFRELCDADQMILEVRVALGQCAHENLAGLLGRRFPPALLVGIHALIRPLQRFGGGRGLGRQEHEAMCSGDGEAGAVVRKGAGGALDDGLGVRVLRAQDAELVAAHPVRRATARDEAVELLAEARQQGVAGGMAEGIVVVLEAVQVEHGEDVRRLLVEGRCEVVE